MPVARILVFATAAIALAACQKGGQAEEQNVVITNGVPENADVEALPPDESSGTSTDELENGADNADVADVNATNSY